MIQAILLDRYDGAIQSLHELQCWIDPIETKHLEEAAALVGK